MESLHIKNHDLLSSTNATLQQTLLLINSGNTIIASLFPLFIIEICRLPPVFGNISRFTIIEKLIITKKPYFIFVIQDA